jgi:hypothetical protein
VHEPTVRSGCLVGRERRDHEQRLIEFIVREFEMTPKQRLGFSRYLHKCKETGDYGHSNQRGDFTLDELREKAMEFLNIA